MTNNEQIKAALEQARQRMAELATEHDELAELLNAQTLAASASPVEYPIGDKVIIRARDAGVHFGTLQSVDGRTVCLTNSRRMWRWWSAGDEISLSGVARHGLADRDEVRITGEVANISILDACEIIAMTDTAIASLENAEVANAR